MLSYLHGTDILSTWLYTHSVVRLAILPNLLRCLLQHGFGHPYKSVPVAASLRLGYLDDLGAWWCSCAADRVQSNV